MASKRKGARLYGCWIGTNVIEHALVRLFICRTHSFVVGKRKGRYSSGVSSSGGCMLGDSTVGRYSKLERARYGSTSNLGVYKANDGEMIKRDWLLS